jgi:mannose-6-phosphate isomerase-like protein (cupin superfamily)
MKRRSFLKASAALLPAAGIRSFALDQAAALATATPSSAEIHVVGSGEDRFAAPHSLGFSTILFKVGSSESNGALFVVEHENLVEGGPPVHYHLHQDEWFYVMEGEVLFQVGSQRKLLRSGESILGPRMVPHGFSSVGEKPGHMLIAFTPAGKMEEFFRAVAIPNGPAMDAEVFRRYDMQYVGPPLKV